MPRFLMLATNLGATTHQGLQFFWNIHTAVGILVILQDGHQCAWHGDACIIQCRNVLNIAICIAIAGVGAARLELADGRTTAQFFVCVFGRNPCLDIVHLNLVKAHVAGGICNYAIW